MVYTYITYKAFLSSYFKITLWLSSLYLHPLSLFPYFLILNLNFRVSTSYLGPRLNSLSLNCLLKKSLKDDLPIYVEYYCIQSGNLAKCLSSETFGLDLF